MVVLGDLRVRNNGPANFVSVGGGTHVVPNNGGDCIVVGGDLSAGSRNIQVFNQALSMNCDIVYKGNAASIGRWKTNGDVKHEPNYDMSRYEETKATLYKKSQYWKTLPSTGTMDYKQWGEGQTSYLCNNKDEIQVFNIQPHQRNWLKSVDTIKFGDDCEGKTILINVQGTGSVDAKAAAMHFKGKKGYEKNGFPTCMTESILWNFPDAADVNIGAGRSSEWHGSVLVGGDLSLTTSGQSGRTMVLGNLVQNRGGSEFHSYQYNPPMSLPDPPDICTLTVGAAMETTQDASSVNVVAIAPTAAPAPAPTAAPVRSGTCKARSLADIKATPNWSKHRTWKTHDNACNKCSPTSPYPHYPCNTPIRICEGNCKFNDGKPDF